jgi:thymidylate synthase
MNNKLDEQYLDLIKDILENGYLSGDRTGTGTKKVFGRMITHDMSEGIALLTCKKMFIRGGIYELLWFLKGDTNIKYLVDNNVNIWVGDCYKKYINDNNVPICYLYNKAGKESCVGDDFYRHYTRKEFIDQIKTNDEFAKIYGELNKVYGSEWVNWNDEINQIQELIDTLKTNPESRRLMVTAWNPSNVRNATLPPCFIENTKIDTINGYKNIQDVTINDKLLTHDNTYQSINKIYKTPYTDALYVLKSWYLPKITSTPNHPFLIKSKEEIINNEYDAYNEDDYTAIKDIDLSKNDKYIAININNKSIIHTYKWFMNHRYRPIEKSTLLNNKKLWYTLGYYLGDGYFIESNKKVYFCIANKDIDKVYPIINDVVKIYPVKNSGENVTKFECKNSFIFNLVQEFGKYSHGKFIPDFVHDMPKEYLEEFLQGYYDADGHFSLKNNKIMYTTVSDSIAYGIQKIYAKLGKVCSISYSIKENKREILGRVCNQRNTYSLGVSNNTNANNYIFSDNYLWIKINDINILENHEYKYVYNFDVDTNHTYTVNNVINHNCHFAFQCFTRELSIQERINILNNQKTGEYLIEATNKFLTNKNIPTREISLMFQMRSTDYGLGLPADLQVYSMLLSMIAQVVNMVPGELKCVTGDSHIYADHIEPIKELLTRETYPLAKLELNPNIKNIFDFKFEDIKVVNYQSSEKLYLPLSN